VVNGLILAEFGKKMIKRLKNYPELTDILDKYGADALRYYLMSSQAVRAEDLAFSEKGLDEVVKKIINRLENVISFYELYTNNESRGHSVSTKHILDRWIDTRFNELTKEVTDGLDKYELDRASRPIADFVDDLSTWYLRRSRNRPEALPKLREILLDLSKLLAPFMPFLAEDIYRRLDGEKESVHLEEWPKGQTLSIDSQGLALMSETRRIVSLALELRQKANIKVRQPLAELKIKNKDLADEYLEIIKDELNVKKISVDASLSEEVWLDTNITPELEEEGRVRDAIRSVQEWRKEKNLKPGEKANYEVRDAEKDLFSKHAEEIKRATNIEF
ncbi:MAG: class I tRNA ligase family protein, partial [Patescibacteria group bacterium]